MFWSRTRGKVFVVGDQAAEPNAFGIMDVAEGAENTAVGRAEIMVKLMGR
jgi:hypothetical protein